MIARVLLAALFLFAGAAHGKNLYVNNSGTPACSDATTYANNDAANPWCTIGRAAWGSTSYASPSTSQAAAAGDVVLITAGTYWENGDSNGGRFTVSLKPANNGSAGNLITFRGVGLVYVRMNNGFRGGMIGCPSGSSYIVWDNLQIDDYYGGSTSDTGPVVFFSSSYCQVINSNIKGHPGSYYHGYATFTGNYRGITLEYADNTTIRNNVIWQFTGGQNEGGILTYDSNDNIIENNTIYGNGCGIFIKGIHTSTQARNIIRKNLVYDSGDCNIRVLGASDTKIYQNVVKNSDGSATGLWAGFADSTRSQFVNNTVYNVSRGMVAQGTDLVDVVFQNNIVVNSGTAALYDWSVSSPTQQDVVWNRNVYYNNATSYIWVSEGGSSLTFAGMQAIGLETNGSTANPEFVDAANGDFRLGANSAARTVGVDVLDLDGDGNTSETIPAGAYVTGNETIGAGTLLLPGPANPRWRPAWLNWIMYARTLH